MFSRRHTNTEQQRSKEEANASTNQPLASVSPVIQAAKMKASGRFHRVDVLASGYRRVRRTTSAALLSRRRRRRLQELG